jgi:hypothetical protein
MVVSLAEEVYVELDTMQCRSGMCGARTYTVAQSGWDGLCEPCAAMDDEHQRGQHQLAVGDCASCN